MIESLYFGKGILKKEVLPQFCQKYPGKKIVIADQKLQTAAADLASRLDADWIAIEAKKDKASLDFLAEELWKRNCHRDTLLIAMGGGTITDLVAFLASIYLRGVPLILIPTTLLAMVDASIGGKTGIDTPFGKNLLGTFYRPEAIFTDPEFLEALPQREWQQGMAEILKLGLVFRADLLKMSQSDPELIFQAIHGKMEVVKRDPTEKGLRRILNFGHTIGHALETVSRYSMPHGEAVAIGSVAEAHLSHHLGYLSAAEFTEVQHLYARFSLRLPKSYNRLKFLEAMALDKKSAAGKVRFVLMDRIGSALSFDGAYCREVSQKELQSSLDWMEKIYG